MSVIAFPFFRQNGAAPDLQRRRLLAALGWGSVGVVCGAGAVATVRFLYPRVLFEPPAYFTIGFPNAFTISEPADGHGVCLVLLKWKKSHRSWIVLEKERMYAIFAKCTHLGCTPSWYDDDRTFKCPCHGSQFFSNGVNFAGPAPRPMDRYKIALAEDGRIVVHTNTLFTYKDFDNPFAYLDLKRITVAGAAGSVP
jgi:cytochrome b6-f complex iron-sulfur subunit